MGLKDWLWNDNASELFSLRKADLPHFREQAQKAVKNSIAMGSTLLFGTEESQGLLKTVSEVSAEAGRRLFTSQRQIDMENALKNHFKSHKRTTTASDEQQNGNCFDYRWDGREGPGYYSGDIKVQDEEDE